MYINPTSVSPLSILFPPSSFSLFSQALASGDAEESLKQAEEVLKIVQSLSDENLPSKLMYVASLHSCIGNAQLELGDTEEALTYHLEDLRIAEEKLVRGEGRLCGWVGTCL